MARAPISSYLMMQCLRRGVNFSVFWFVLGWGSREHFITTALAKTRSAQTGEVAETVLTKPKNRLRGKVNKAGQRRKVEGGNLGAHDCSQGLDRDSFLANSSGIQVIQFNMNGPIGYFVLLWI